jgi:hypothetical protein
MSALSDPQANTQASSSLLNRMKSTFSSTSQQLLAKSSGQVVDDQSTPQVTSTVVSDQTVISDQVQTLPAVDQPEEVIAQAVPQVIQKQTDTLNPPNAVGGSAKEAPLLSVTVERPAVDAVPGVQDVEFEKAHELPPEVEGFIKTVEDHQEQIPQEIVISNPQTGQVLPRVMAQPVVVLPITPDIEAQGKNKQPTYSVRWLIEWSWKIMKIFSGKVVYRKSGAS